MRGSRLAFAGNSSDRDRIRRLSLASMWQVALLPAEGKLVQVLPGCRQEATVWAVCPVRLDRSATLRVAVAFLVQWFKPRPQREGV